MTERKELVLQYQIEIRPLKETDINAIDPILRQHVRDRQTGQILEDEIKEIKDYMKGTKDEYGRKRKYFIAKSLDGRVVGCMCYSTMDPSMIEHFNDISPDESVELLNAFVDSQIFRGGGVGRKLFEAVCQSARLENKKFLTVNSGPRYKESWGFYDHMCDEDRGMIFQKYGQGGDAKTWLKKL